MPENDDYVKTLTEALAARADWLEKSELPKLKEELRNYHTGFASLYNLYIKKGLIHEDPYKQEAKIGELEVPIATPYSEQEKMDQLTRRLANYDNQLDFLVNFYQFSIEFLNLDRIKRILGLIRYIDWVHLSPDAQGIMTCAVADITNQVKIGTDSLTMSVISESLSNLSKSFNPIMGMLKALSDYQREYYKLEIRQICAGMSPNEAANIQQIRKRFAQAKSRTAFYPDLVEEIIKEDFSKDGPGLKEDVLNKLKVEEKKQKEEKKQVSFKGTLIEGIQGLGGTSGTFTEIMVKLDENQSILLNTKKGFLHRLIEFFKRMFNQEQAPTIYEIEYMDPVKAIPVREKINFATFRGDLDRRIKILTPLGARGTAVAKLEAMQEEQLESFLERNIKELQSLHKTISALDEFFKAEVSKEDRDKVRGIKPELATIKNAVLRANSKRHEYTAQKEEEEQLKRLGVKTSVT